MVFRIDAVRLLAFSVIQGDALEANIHAGLQACPTLVLRTFLG